MNDSPSKHTSSIDKLRHIMRQLRHPETGCPWDLKQSFATIAPYTIEEAYEVEDAIARNNLADLKDELGDLLFQVVFHAQLAEELGIFNFDDVAEAVSQKMERRHPHVFDEVDVENADDVVQNWEAIKAKERSEKATGIASLMDDIPASLPALTQAVKIQKRAADVGFDWPTVDPIFEKLAEETDELRLEINQGSDKTRLQDELGDMLFVLANLARKLNLDPEQATRSTNRKFIKRFQWMENQTNLSSMSLGEQEALWQKAKAQSQNES